MIILLIILLLIFGGGGGYYGYGRWGHGGGAGVGLRAEEGQGILAGAVHVGGWMWYIVDVGPVKPSVPKSSSEYRQPSGRRNWTWRFRGSRPSFM